MGNTQFYSQQFEAAGWTGFSLATVGATLTIVLTLYFSYKENKLIESFKPWDSMGRYKFNFSNMATPFLLMFMYLIVVANSEITWTLRAGSPSVVCNESTADSGNCASLTRALSYIVVFSVFGFSWGKFMKWKSIWQLLYVLAAAIEFFGISLFTLFYLQWPRYLFLIIGTAAGAFNFFVHYASAVISVFHIQETDEVELPKGTVERYPNIRNAKHTFGNFDIKGSRWINKINYPLFTPEQILNIAFGGYTIVYPLFYFLGPHGLKKWSASDESFVLMTFDVVYVLMPCIFFAVFYVYKERIELLSIGKRIGLIGQGNKPLLKFGNGGLPRTK